jgi:hypothetical protein
MDYIASLIEQNRFLKDTNTAYLDSLGKPWLAGLKKERASREVCALGACVGREVQKFEPTRGEDGFVGEVKGVCP